MDILHSLPFYWFTSYFPLPVFAFLGILFENINGIYNEANIESFLRNCSFLTLFISMIFYWIQTAFSSSNSYSSSFNFLAPLKIRAFSFSEAKQSVPKIDAKEKNQSVVVFNTTKFTLINFGTMTMIISNILLSFLLMFRWIDSGHFPLSNLYESLMFLSWSCTFIHLFLELKTELVKPEAIFLTKVIGSITSPIALFTNAFATFNLPTEMQKASPLVPALQSNWLMMHVTVMIISYSALILGSLLSIAFLILISSSSIPNFNSFFHHLQLGLARNISNNELYQGQGPLEKNPFLSKSKMTLAWNFDNLSYRIIGIGFPFLTIGILSGAVWANEAWGSYWSWDPKETWALATWLVFAIYLHARITKGWQGKKPAIIASFGFLAIWICFLGVNLIGEGMHSYGFISHSGV
jgi:cytochrome c-type biogenesis protein CcsB